MFHVEFFVDDRKLGQALIALVGLATGKPTVEPVANVNANGKAATNGTMSEMFIAHAREHNLKQVGPHEIKTFAKAAGFSNGSYSYAIRTLVENRILKKTKQRVPGRGTGFIYTVHVPAATTATGA